jgi:5-methylcytosine-specific restriction endonuclease McrA
MSAQPERGQLPKAYLRIDPNLDSTHPAPADMVALLCAANRQPKRGRFKSPELAMRVLGKGLFNRAMRRGDLIAEEDGLYVAHWDEWQEGNLPVGDRMRLIRGQTKTSGARRTANWRLRTAVFERDNHTCRYCGVSDYPRDWLVLEHVVPHPNGGMDEDNLVTACRPCNKRKGGRTPEEAGMPLLSLALRAVSR